MKLIDAEHEKQYDTLVCEAVKRSPLEFVDILNQAAKDAEKNLQPLLHEAACVIANLLLTCEEWHLKAPNDPLTLEELREMGLEQGPVYLYDIRYSSFSWRIVDFANKHFVSFTDGGSRLLKDYGKIWLAYRQKPEEVS